MFKLHASPIRTWESTHSSSYRFMERWSPHHCIICLGYNLRYHWNKRQHTGKWDYLFKVCVLIYKLLFFFLTLMYKFNMIKQFHCCLRNVNSRRRGWTRQQSFPTTGYLKYGPDCVENSADVQRPRSGRTWEVLLVYRVPIMFLNKIYFKNMKLNPCSVTVWDADWWKPCGVWRFISAGLRC